MKTIKSGLSELYFEICVDMEFVGKVHRRDGWFCLCACENMWLRDLCHITDTDKQTRHDSTQKTQALLTSLSAGWGHTCLEPSQSLMLFWLLLQNIYVNTWLLTWIFNLHKSTMALLCALEMVQCVFEHVSCILWRKLKYQVFSQKYSKTVIFWNI